MRKRWGFMRALCVAHPAMAHRTCHLSALSEKVGGILTQLVVQGHASHSVGANRHAKASARA